MVSIKRRIWFYGVWCWLIVQGLLWVAVIAVLAIVGILNWVVAHAWLLGLVTLLPCAAMVFGFVRWIMRLRQDVRAGVHAELKRIGCCPQCGYDLRASVERCPECGYQIMKTIEV